jgi:predicted enzyme related to lactoylglutathione lyase
MQPFSAAPPHSGMKRLTAFALFAAAAMLPLAPHAQTGPRIAYQPDVVLQLAVTDLDRAIRFYVDVLEFTLTERRDDLGFAHIQTNVPGLEIGLSTGMPQAGNGGSIVNIGVADVNAARALLESRGVAFTGAVQIIPGKVALAGFLDPDGNHLRLAGPVEAGTEVPAYTFTASCRNSEARSPILFAIWMPSSGPNFPRNFSIGMTAFAMARWPPALPMSLK